jgi:hypothetical protein
MVAGFYRLKLILYRKQKNLPVTVSGLMFPEQPELPDHQAGQHDQNGCRNKSMVKKWHIVRI